MIVPSIDLQNGHAVQLVGGKERKLDAGDPLPLAVRFGAVGEIAVIDLDAAMGKGSNAAVIEDLLRRARCRVGGGIRDVDTALGWLDRGAREVILGTAARPEILRELPRARTCAALDAVHGEVVVEGWTRATGRSVIERMAELREHVGHFLVTFVEREGRMQGLDLDFAKKLREAAGDCRLTVAGGVARTEEIAELDALGIDVQIGMALYTGAISLADGFLAPLLHRDPDALWPTVVCDEDGRALGMVHSNRASVQHALDTMRGVYHSRRRGLWVKGASSGDTQELLRIDLDCDRDALRFTVRQNGTGFCHVGTRSCWGEDRGVPRLARRLAERAHAAPAGSYTRRLLDDPDLLSAKLEEEARELAQARDRDHVIAEAADLTYFALVALARVGADWSDVQSALDRREMKVTRRKGDAKPGALDAVRTRAKGPSEERT
jgi:phosphoribosyl-AMP cyclohydrolase / phosphoribosyl-ATP pyrophosphohydrolase